MSLSSLPSPARRRAARHPQLEAAEAKSRAIQRLQLVRKAVLLGLILVVVALATFSRPLGAEAPLHETLETSGLILIGIAIVGRAWCSLYIGGRKKAEIVDRGPYSISRNPLYVFSFIAAFGMGAQTGSVALAVMFLMIAVVVFWATVKGEEAWLLDAFGPSYSIYLERTPRFWPDFSKWRDADTLQIRPAFFLRTIRDGAVFLLALPIFELIEQAQRAGWITPWLVLP
jgi:protein-S-isoprenylcysteine O-methyltransferase Ste14